MHKSIRLFLIILSTAGVLNACSSNAYKVTLNNNVLYDPYPVTDSGLLNDANLQGCLNQVLITTGNSDPTQITSLACPSAGVENLQGIAALSNLEQIDLSDNTISDLGPLINLKKLRVASLRNNRIRYIDILNAMPALRFISLQGNTNIACKQLDELEHRVGSSLNRPLSCR